MVSVCSLRGCIFILLATEPILIKGLAMNEGMERPVPPATPDLSAQHNLFSTVVLNLSDEGYVEKTVNDIEWTYKRKDAFRSIADTHATNIESVKEYLIENYDELEDHADQIATMLDIELTREVEYSVSMSATVTITVAMGEDAEDIINDSLYIDSNTGTISVDNYDIDSVYEA